MPLPAADFCIAIPSKNRHPSLVTTLASAVACGWPILICDQSATPFAESDQWQVLHQPQLNGLPAARNVLLQAAAAAGHQIVVFIDDDSDLAEDFAAVCSAVVAAQPNVAAWGPVIETRSRWTRRLLRLLQLGFARDPRRLTAGPMDAPTRALFGCCFAVRIAAARAVGGFDARRPGYALGEDLDFCLRLHQAGYRLRFCRNLRAVHREERSGRADPVARGEAKIRFLVWLARRHGGGNPATLCHLGLAVLAAASGRGREPAALSGIWRGLRATLLRS